MSNSNSAATPGSATATTSDSRIASIRGNARAWDHGRRFRRAFWRSATGRLGFILILMLLLCAIFADKLAPYSPVSQDYDAILQPPSTQHLAGTDEVGRDLLSRLLYGGRISLTIGVLAESIASSVGIVMGTLAGWYGGWIDDVIMRGCEVIFAIPGLLFLIVWVSIFGRNPINIFLALGLISWPGNARLMRALVLTVRDQEYIIAARSLGAQTWHILLRHIIPNVIMPMIVLASLGVAGAILSESILSFLGLGIEIPTPSWGAMIDTGRNYMSQAWWYAVFPGLALMLTIMSFNFLSDGLRESIDPLSNREN